MVEAQDLEYGQAQGRKRAPGASPMVQKIYALLVDHPEGLTRDQIHDVLKDGWSDTDAYRGYAKYLKTNQAYSCRVRGSTPRTSQSIYGSTTFNNSAQRWWVRQKLGSMVAHGLVCRDGERFYNTDKLPTVISGTYITRTGKRKIVMGAFNPKAHQEYKDRDNAHHLRRENLRSELIEALNDKKRLPQGRNRDLVQKAYDFISGR